MENRSRIYSYAVLVLVAFAVGTAANSTLAPVTEVTASTPAPNTPVSSQSTVPSVVVTPSATNAVAETVKTSSVNNDTTLLPIDIYYEGMCSDSVVFMEKQFTPVYEKLNAYMTVTFIPFAQGEYKDINGTNSTVTCHREGECEADIVHTCAIQYIKIKDDLVKFITCALTEGFKNKTVPVEKCGNQSKIDDTIVKSIQTCIASVLEYMPLLKEDYNLATAEHVTNVPRIVFNKKYTNETQKLAEDNFLTAVCSEIKSKPDACKNIISGSDTVVVGILPILIGVYYLIKMF